VVSAPSRAVESASLVDADGDGVIHAVDLRMEEGRALLKSRDTVSKLCGARHEPWKA
jgi:hypothetical protein